MGARPQLQLLLIRLCVGLAFLPHAAPKLFAGVEAREALARRLVDLGIPHALQIVVLAGVIELALGLVLSLGCYTRTSALIAALYLAASAYLLPPQYGIIWILICASFVLSGGGRWSVDAWLKAAPAEEDPHATALARQRPDR
jgi:putative oxidoreductase